MSIFSTDTFISSEISHLDYESRLDFIRWMLDNEITDSEEDREDYSRYTSYLNALESNKDTDAGLGVVNTPDGIVYFGGKTVREVLDLMSKLLAPIQAKTDESVYFYGIDDTNTMVIE